MDYLTSEEKSRLEQELREAMRRRREITERLAHARELGDLSENAEYHAAREDQGLNEARIRQMEQQLAMAVVTDSETMPEGIVFVGMTVRLRDVESGAEELYRLVGKASGRYDMEYLEVTPQSPMGMALMKARVGEVVRVDLRRGERRLEIMEIVG